MQKRTKTYGKSILSSNICILSNLDRECFEYPLQQKRIPKFYRFSSFKTKNWSNFLLICLLYDSMKRSKVKRPKNSIFDNSESTKTCKLITFLITIEFVQFFHIIREKHVRKNY